MRGDLVGVWSEMWRNVWKKLADHRDAPEDLFCELYRELNDARANPLDPATELANIVDDPAQARVAFRKTRAADLAGEQAIVAFLERAHPEIENLGSLALTDRYFTLVGAFLEKYSLRYDLRRPFSLHPTLPGVFARLMRDLRQATSQDAHLDTLMTSFEQRVRDLKNDQSPDRIKSCLHAQMNLLEALAQRCDGVAPNTLSAMCGQINTWPHATVRDSVKKLYGFASDYPGIRHAGNPANQLREIEMRDLVALTVVMAGFSPYLTNLLNNETIFCDPP